MHLKLSLTVMIVAILSNGVVRGQTIGIDDLLSLGGGSLTFSGTTPQASLNIYSATALRSRGICGGATLTDLAILPYFSLGGSSGTYAAPQALVQIGHVVSSPQVGGWSANLIAPITIHGLGSGPYSFSWTTNTFVPLPGFGSSGFVWDGVRDVGILYAAPAVLAGGFFARTSSERRHVDSSFPPVAGSGVDGPGALKVRMTFTPGAPCATSNAIGTGCYRRASSFYEWFPNLNTFDLPGSVASVVVLRATPSPTGFAVTFAPSAWFTPSPSSLLGASSGPPMGDDSLSVPMSLPFVFPFPGGQTNVIQVASDGYVLLQPTSATMSDPTPTVAELLGGLPRLSPLWADLDPSNTAPGRGVYFEVDQIGQLVYLTWYDCLDGRSSPGAPNTSIYVQCVLHSSGWFEFRYRGVTTNPAALGGALVGWSPGAPTGGSANDPGSIDLSLAMPFSTTGPESPPLNLDADIPSLGANWRLTIEPIDGLVPVALLFFGTGSLPGPDLGAIGAPGCRAYCTADITSISVPAIGGVATASATIPAHPQLLGVAFTAQAGAFTFLNPLGLLTSNGMQFVVGT